MKHERTGIATCEDWVTDQSSEHARQGQLLQVTVARRVPFSMLLKQARKLGIGVEIEA